MIIKGSRYSEKIETRNDETKSIAISTPYSTQSYYTIVSEDGDTFQSLAQRHLNNPSLYWKLADVNKTVRYPDAIPAGTVLNIPLR